MLRTVAFATLGLMLAVEAPCQQSDSRTPPPSKDTEKKPVKAPSPAPPVDDDLKPPMAGAPAKGSRGRMEPAANRDAEGSYCSLDGDFNFTTIAPANSVARTASAQPVLFWYVPKVPTCPVVFTLSVDAKDLPLVEKEIPVRSAGLQRLNLADFGISLEPGTMYRWFVAVVPDARRRSRDLISGALLQYDPGATGSWHDRFSLVNVKSDTPESDQELSFLLQEAGLGQLSTAPQSPHRH
jgi:hypothetical protein